MKLSNFLIINKIAVAGIVMKVALKLLLIGT